ncbi:hypothetical protein HYPP_00730 [Hyphomicrobium sp. ghe19]|nr:hypothetical protein HYPP_00730 [Hyphomicrobium sp. ghe19]
MFRRLSYDRRGAHARFRNCGVPKAIFMRHIAGQSVVTKLLVSRFRLIDEIRHDDYLPHATKWIVERYEDQPLISME